MFDLNTDILVNNAGIVIGKPFLETTDEQTEKVMNVNAMAPMFMVKAFLPGMLARLPHTSVCSRAYLTLLYARAHTLTLRVRACVHPYPRTSHASMRARTHTLTLRALH